MVILRILLFAVALFSATFATANDPPTKTADTESPQKLAATCVACHGPNGNSSITQWPKIAGQNKTYLIKQMHDFANEKSGRENAIMHQIVAALSENDIEQLAVYFEDQKISTGVAEAVKVYLGQEVYRGGLLGQEVPACAACHGPRGEGNAEAGFPALSGQQADYVISQLQAFRAGKRTNDTHHIMRDIAVHLNDESMVAVASYISGLH
jgi:cytochrome c553